MKKYVYECPYCGSPFAGLHNNFCYAYHKDQYAERKFIEKNSARD